MPPKSKYEVRVPTHTYAMSINSSRCEGKRLKFRQAQFDNHATLFSRQVRSRQAAVLRRFYNLCGSELLEAELEGLDKRVAEVCPDDILQMEGIFLTRNKTTIPEPEPPPPPHSPLKSQKKKETQKTQPLSDLGVVTISGRLVIAPNHSRPLYPWETQAGMLWIKSLGSTLRPEIKSVEIAPRIHDQRIDLVPLSDTTPDEDGPDSVTQIDTPQTTPTCPLQNTKQKSGSFDDIVGVLNSYEQQHQKLFIRNKFKSKRWEAATKYDVMYITENLQKRGSDNSNIRRSMTAIPDSATEEEGDITPHNTEESFLQLKMREFKIRKCQSVYGSMHGVKLPVIAEG